LKAGDFSSSLLFCGGRGVSRFGAAALGAGYTLRLAENLALRPEATVIGSIFGGHSSENARTGALRGLRITGGFSLKYEGKTWSVRPEARCVINGGGGGLTATSLPENLQLSAPRIKLRRVCGEFSLGFTKSLDKDLSTSASFSLSNAKPAFALNVVKRF
jgi:hypothetical protein